jgi:Putative transposase/Transposase zinc-binding domain
MALSFAGARPDVADIVRQHRAALESLQRLNSRQRRVLTDIAQCRTATLGGYDERCTACDYKREVYLSCRNRHCPKCQSLAQEKWIEQQRQRTLNVKHFHVVFTLPAQLRPLAAFAPALVYGMLFAAVGRTLLEFGEQRLGATLGATLVLHTWTRELEYHPHIHAIVTAGGLGLCGDRFIDCRPDFLFPVKALGKVFRAKMLESLWTHHRKSAFAGFPRFDDPEAFGSLINRLPRKSWYTYSKPAFGRAEHVLQYLGRYTHRVGISNSRLVDVFDEHVTFRTRGRKTVTITGPEFVRRLVQHVLPDGFHKIRHFGLNASKQRRAQAAGLLDAPSQVVPRKRTWQEQLSELTGHDPSRCPRCNAPLESFSLPGVVRARSPPTIKQRAA